ncbi:hypothetical protein T265_10387 [Opisthorchis viverrini]|uniref:Uncharacterized protein n=1 Tax=Opisthorchis viverrini TaxID=6198 RepID=A0A074ZDE8_OPIVI|nr:hypothetical protein T265_10387 [Opisthorchis viverrini]KER21225.1 hypothetical protein T265_10387 [Opisthorchis viverrini]
MSHMIDASYVIDPNESSFVYQMPNTLSVSIQCGLTTAEAMTIQLRILFKLNVDERSVRDAQNIGQVYPYLYDLACTNTVLHHPWLNSCQIGRYYINRFSDRTAIVLVDSETSTVADEELASIDDEDQKLLTIANRLNSYIGARWLKWLERELTYRNLRVSNPTSASRLPLSRLGQPNSIPALVLPSGGMAVGHPKGCYS